MFEIVLLTTHCDVAATAPDNRAAHSLGPYGRLTLKISNLERSLSPFSRVPAIQALKAAGLAYVSGRPADGQTGG